MTSFGAFEQVALGGNPRTLWAADRLLQPFRPLAKSWHAITGQKGIENDGGMGRSRGGFTSKIYAFVNAEGRPVSQRPKALIST